ncbi:MAG: hypothetical protein HIU84_08650 [Acidobacteria bacterium]|nr:hypothetical protein [Acidobacteriota bacterium]
MNYGLAPRPELGPEETAAVIAAAQELMRERIHDEELDPTPAWRFSGRWFHAGPLAMRRPRGVN